MSSFHRKQKLLFLPFLVHVNSGNFRATVTYFLKNILYSPSEVFLRCIDVQKRRLSFQNLVILLFLSRTGSTTFLENFRALATK